MRPLILLGRGQLFEGDIGVGEAAVVHRAAAR